ncbi:RNase H domain-containing protein [Trichonephila clavipes]|nr:RNase H domain-containing protein [Trichonephila clavipes]
MSYNDFCIGHTVLIGMVLGLLFGINFIGFCTYKNSFQEVDLDCLHGSRSDTGRAGNGIFSNPPGNDVKISIRNSDHCSVFRSELIASSGALDNALNSYKDSICIVTGSRSSIQYLKNWPKFMESTGLDILSKIVWFGQRKQVFSPVDCITCGCAWE